MLILENFYGAIFTENLQAIASIDDLIISLLSDEVSYRKVPPRNLFRHL